MNHKIVPRIFSSSLVTYGAAAMLLFFIGDYKIACIDRLNVFPPIMSSYPMLLDKNETAFNETSLRESLHYYKVLRETFPGFDQPYNMMAFCYSIDGNNELAAKYFQEAKNRRPERFWYDYNLGVLLNKKGDKERSMGYFKAIVQSDDQKLMEASLLAPLSKLSPQERQGFYKSALGFAVHIKDLSLRNIIRIDFDLQRYEEIIKIALMASRNSAPTDKTAFLMYAGVASYQSGQFEVAAGLFKTILDQEPGQIWAKAYLILSKMKLEGVNIKENGKILKEFLNDPVLFPPDLGKIMLHPWSYLIAPGKEIYY